MHCADPEQRQKIAIGQLAHEMHARPIGIGNGATHLGNHPFLPGAAVARGGAIAYTIAAHHDHPRVRAAAQQIAQPPHENVKPPVRFQIAVDEGDHLIRAAQRHTVQRDPRRRIRAHMIGVDAVMHHGDLAPQLGGVGRCLPFGGTQRHIGAFQLQAHRQIAHPHPRTFAKGTLQREFRIKSDVRAAGLIVEFAEHAQPRLRPDLLQEQRLAPARVRNDHIGGIPLLRQGIRRLVNRRPPVHRAVQVGQPGMMPLVARLGKGIGDDLHAVPLLRLVHPAGQRRHPVPLRRKGGGKMFELTGEVLMQEQNFHSVAPPGFCLSPTLYSSKAMCHPAKSATGPIVSRAISSLR